MNKWVLAWLVALTFSLPAKALIQPLTMNFQGKLINPATNNPQTGNVNLVFNLYSAQTGGSAIWNESQNSVALNNGVFTVELGTYTALPRDLFLGASVYLGVTVSGDTEMLPRTRLVMSPYAFTANQLSDTNEVRLIAGPTYSTFTSAGNLSTPGGIVASSGSFANGITVSSVTITGGVLAVGGSSFTVSGGSATVAYGLTAGSLSINGAGSSAGGVLYMTASGSMSVTSAGTAGFRLISGGSGPPVWDDPTVNTLTSLPLTPNSSAAAVANTSQTVRKTGLFRVAGRITVNQLTFTVGAVTTAGTYKICVYSEDGQTKVIDVTSGAPAVGANNVAVAGSPVLSSGLYYVAMGCAATCSNTVFQWTTVSVPGFNAATSPAGKEVLEGTTTHTSGTCNATLPAITAAISSTPLIRFDN